MVIYVHDFARKNVVEFIGDIARVRVKVGVLA